MGILEDNPTTAALAGVLVGALLGFFGSILAARVGATQAEQGRLQARRQDWLQRLAAAVAEIDTIHGRLNATNIRIGTINEQLQAGQWESLEKQIGVRRELRTVGLLAGAGGDAGIARECSATEQRLSEFVEAVYGVFESVRGTEDPSLMEPRLERASDALSAAVGNLVQVLGSLNAEVR